VCWPQALPLTLSLSLSLTQTQTLTLTLTSSLTLTLTSTLTLTLTLTEAARRAVPLYRELQLFTLDATSRCFLVRGRARV